jgi:Ribbon-helix-helix protein, copG family
MNHTISIRVSEELAAWLEDTAAKTGVSQGKIVREQLERARAAAANQGFMRLAGSVKGPKNLSSRKGFSRA